MQREDVQEVETDYYIEDSAIASLSEIWETTLFLALYHDDLEVTYPLGSKRGVHKCG